MDTWLKLVFVIAGLAVGRRHVSNTDIQFRATRPYTDSDRADLQSAAPALLPTPTTTTTTTTTTSTTTTTTTAIPATTTTVTTSATSEDSAHLIDHSRLIGVACSNALKCLFQLEPPFPKQNAKRLGLAVNDTKPDQCSDPDSDTVYCCRILMHEVNKKLAESTPSQIIVLLKNSCQLNCSGLCHGCSDPDSDTVNCCRNLMNKVNEKLAESKIRVLLKNSCQLNCSGLCHYVECQQLPGCIRTSTSLPSSASSSPPSTSLTSSFFTSDETTTRRDNTSGASTSGEKTSRTTTIIIIVVTCLVAFFAGIGGAFLILYLRKRWRAGKGSDKTDQPRTNNADRELGALPRKAEPSHTKTDAHQATASTTTRTTTTTTTSNNKNTTTSGIRNSNDYTTTKRVSFSEHEYSCIADHHLTKQQDTSPSTTTTAAATTTTKPKTPTAPAYDNVHAVSTGLGSQDRKLPTAPAPSPEPQLLAEKAQSARDKRSPSRPGPLGDDYSYVTRPRSESEEGGGRGRGDFAEGKIGRDKTEGAPEVPPPPAWSKGDYFVLEDRENETERDDDERQAARGREEKEDEETTTKPELENEMAEPSLESAGHYFTLEREGPEGEEEEEGGGRNEQQATTRGRYTYGRERTLSVSTASNSEGYYSPLNLSDRHANSDYTALDLPDDEPPQETEGEESRDYLEVLPDYELSKPVK